MAKKPEITPIDTSFNVVGTLSQNFENIKEAFENTLSLDGSTPNAMRSDLDLNSNDLLNVGRVEATDLVLSGGSLLGFVEEAGQSANVAVAARDSAVLAKGAAEEARRAADDLTGHLMGGGAGQLLRKNSNADYDYGWQTISGTGDMVESVYDPQGIREDAFNMDFMVDGTSQVAMTVAERTAVEGSVRHDTVQSLTTGQQQQARENIAAVSYDAQTLSDAQRGQARNNIRTPLLPTSNTWRRDYFTAGQAVILPSGGTWAYFYIRRLNDGTINAIDGGVASGGTNLLTLGPTESCHNLVWKVQ